MFAPSVTRVSLTCVIRRAFIEIFSMKNRKGYANEPVATFRGSFGLSVSLSLSLSLSFDQSERGRARIDTHRLFGKPYRFNV